MQIPNEVLVHFSAKGKGYIEAGLKMAEGFRLVYEAQLELAQLDGKSKKSGGHVVTDALQQLMSDVSTPKAPRRHPKAPRRHPKAGKKQTLGGNSKTRRQAKAKAGDPEQQAADEAAILALLEEHPLPTNLFMMKKLNRSFYPIKRALKNLLKAKKLKRATSRTAAGREYPTWELR